jgi:hypothetical protein
VINVLNCSKHAGFIRALYGGGSLKPLSKTVFTRERASSNKEPESIKGALSLETGPW